MSGRLKLDDDSEEELFDCNSSQSNLSQLFDLGSAILVSTDGNQHFTYKAPRAPDVEQQSSSKGKSEMESSERIHTSHSKLQLIHVAAASTFLFRRDSGEYVKYGKLGCALLGNVTSREIQNNMYFQFTDSAGQLWSLAFDSSDALLLWTKWVMAICALLNNKPEIAYKDFTSGEGEPVAMNDSVEVTLSECLIQPGPTVLELTPTPSSDPVRLKVGRTKGWESEIAGMRKGDCRIFVIPADHNVSEKEVHVALMRLLIVFVRKVKFSKSSDIHSEKSQRDVSQDLPSLSVLEVEKEPSNSELLPQAIETDSSLAEHSSKEEIMSRVKKLGHSMFPQPSTKLDSVNTIVETQLAEEQVVACAPALSNTTLRHSTNTCKSVSMQTELQGCHFYNRNGGDYPHVPNLCTVSGHSGGSVNREQFKDTSTSNDILREILGKLENIDRYLGRSQIQKKKPVAAESDVVSLLQNEALQDLLAKLVRKEVAATKDKEPLNHKYTVRKILNVFYTRLVARFSADGVYSGNDVLEFCLGAIKEVTLESLHSSAAPAVNAELSHDNAVSNDL